MNKRHAPFRDTSERQFTAEERMIRSLETVMNSTRRSRLQTTMTPARQGMDNMYHSILFVLPFSELVTGGSTAAHIKPDTPWSVLFSLLEEYLQRVVVAPVLNNTEHKPDVFMTIRYIPTTQGELVEPGNRKREDWWGVVYRLCVHATVEKLKGFHSFLMLLATPSAVIDDICRYMVGDEAEQKQTSSPLDRKFESIHERVFNDMADTKWYTRTEKPYTGQRKHAIRDYLNSISAIFSVIGTLPASVCGDIGWDNHRAGDWTHPRSALSVNMWKKYIDVTAASSGSNAGASSCISDRISNTDYSFYSRDGVYPVVIMCLHCDWRQPTLLNWSDDTHGDTNKDGDADDDIDYTYNDGDDEQTLSSSEEEPNIDTYRAPPQGEAILLQRAEQPTQDPRSMQNQAMYIEDMKTQMRLHSGKIAAVRQKYEDARKAGTGQFKEIRQEYEDAIRSSVYTAFKHVGWGSLEHGHDVPLRIRGLCMTVTKEIEQQPIGTLLGGDNAPTTTLNTLHEQTLAFMTDVAEKAGAKSLFAYYAHVVHATLTAPWIPKQASAHMVFTGTTSQGKTTMLIIVSNMMIPRGLSVDLINPTPAWFRGHRGHEGVFCLYFGGEGSQWLTGDKPLTPEEEELLLSFFGDASVTVNRSSPDTLEATSTKLMRGGVFVGAANHIRATGLSPALQNRFTPVIMEADPGETNDMAGIALAGITETTREHPWLVAHRIMYTVTALHAFLSCDKNGFVPRSISLVIEQAINRARMALENAGYKTAKLPLIRMLNQAAVVAMNVAVMNACYQCLNPALNPGGRVFSLKLPEDILAEILTYVTMNVHPTIQDVLYALSMFRGSFSPPQISPVASYIRRCVQGNAKYASARVLNACGNVYKIPFKEFEAKTESDLLACLAMNSGIGDPKLAATVLSPFRAMEFRERTLSPLYVKACDVNDDLTRQLTKTLTGNTSVSVNYTENWQKTGSSLVNLITAIHGKASETKDTDTCSESIVRAIARYLPVPLDIRASDYGKCDEASRDGIKPIMTVQTLTQATMILEYVRTNAIPDNVNVPKPKLPPSLSQFSFLSNPLLAVQCVVIAVEQPPFDTEHELSMRADLNEASLASLSGHGPWMPLVYHAINTQQVMVPGFNVQVATYQAKGGISYISVHRRILDMADENNTPWARVVAEVSTITNTAGQYYTMPRPLAYSNEDAASLFGTSQPKDKHVAQTHLPRFERLKHNDKPQVLHRGHTSDYDDALRIGFGYDATGSKAVHLPTTTSIEKLQLQLHDYRVCAIPGERTYDTHPYDKDEFNRYIGTLNATNVYPWYRLRSVQAIRTIPLATTVL